MLGTTVSCPSPKLWTQSRLASPPRGAGGVGDTHWGATETWKSWSSWEKYREFPHTWGEADNSSQGPIKYLQALDFVLNFCVKLNSHEKARPTGWVGRRQSKASVAQAAASILASGSPPAKPNMFQAQVLAEKKLLIKPDYAKLCGVFSMWTEVHWGLSWDHQTLFVPDPGVRLERRPAEAALADCSLPSSLSFSQGPYFKVVESVGFYDVGSWVYSFVFTV